MLQRHEYSRKLQQEVRLLKQHLGALIPNPPVPRYLYHYRRLEILLKILDSGTLRLYDVWTMEDPEEVNYPWGIIWRLMQPYVGRLPFHLADLLNPGLQKDVGRARRRNVVSVLHPFASCFCQADETAFMWRKYADRFMGASLRIHSAPFRDTPNTHALYPMMYGPREVEKSLRSFYQYVVSRDWINRFDFEQGRALSLEAVMSLVTFLVCLKRRRFCGEHEWRAMKMRGSTGPWQMDAASGRSYIEIPLRPECVSAIVLGSKCPLSATDLRERLRNSQYKSAIVTRSKLRA